jgi:hypothetical protein
MATMAIFSLRMQMFGGGPIGNFSCFVTLRHVKDPNVKDPNVKEVADGTPCKFRCLMHHFPAFCTITKTLIANSTKASSPFCSICVVRFKMSNVDQHFSSRVVAMVKMLNNVDGRKKTCECQTRNFVKQKRHRKIAAPSSRVGQRNDVRAMGRAPSRQTRATFVSDVSDVVEVVSILDSARCDHPS